MKLKLVGLLFCFCVGVAEAKIGLTSTIAREGGATPDFPNIVFFFVDDMGWQDTSVPFYTEKTSLNQRYHTPNMALLARQGMKFTQAYASAVCSPSRVSLMTGMNAARHRVTNWTLNKDVSPDIENPVVEPPKWNVNGLSPDPSVPYTVTAKTLPSLMKEAGYRTIHVGKAHFGAKGTPGEEPLNLGFDINIGGHAAGGPGSYLGIHKFSADWRDPGNHIWDIPGLASYHGQEIYLTEALTREALKEISKSVETEQPFYLYMSHYAIHAPWENDERYCHKYIAQGLSEDEATYASMIEGMDKSLGDIMEHLEQLGVADNTIIVFMSDNGVHKQMPQNKPLRGHKLSPYEGGIRVPLLVKWPGVVSPQTVNDEYVIIEDIFPTFLEMAGLRKYAQKSVDGKSFVHKLKGKTSSRQRPLLWHYPNTYYNPPYSVVRLGGWKLIYHHQDQRMELFNINKDIGETTDLSKVEEAKTKEMADLMTKLLKDTKAQMPIIKATGERVPFPSELTLSSYVHQSLLRSGSPSKPVDRQLFWGSSSSRYPLGQTMPILNASTGFNQKNLTR
ncbi:sulfatase [Echinicola strongylocentroti]|uniref:Sulfatase n=1 Tax=Echinicola strongylocentroti TaxID=1795355 RepID=A0A2Z4IMY9_9BACT|nr:sulfatase [Echinicola strongylocentroti]AWW32204.1 sulfatase [Echinicola strongylocentroti]